MSNLELIWDYKDNDIYRRSFSELSRSVFGIDFEEFYQRGFWNGQYIPYSYIDKGNVIANVSVNKFDMVIKGERIKALQIGTVMTHPDYRGNGLAGRLMIHVLKQYEKLYEIIYLFANSGVLGFYPRFGFKPLKQSLFKHDIHIDAAKPARLKKLDITNSEDMNIIRQLALERRVVSKILGVENADYLFMFYCLYEYSDYIFYMDDLNALIIFEIEDRVIHIYDIVTREELGFMEIIKRIVPDGEYTVIFHFTPDFHDIRVQRVPYDDIDDNFFIKTNTICVPEGLLFPVTAHA